MTLKLFHGWCLERKSVRLYKYLYGNLTNLNKNGEWSCNGKLVQEVLAELPKKFENTLFNFRNGLLGKVPYHGMTLILSQYCQPWIMAPMLLCWTPRFASELERLRHLFEEDNATEGVSSVGASNNAASEDN